MGAHDALPYSIVGRGRDTDIPPLFSHSPPPELVSPLFRPKLSLWLSTLQSCLLSATDATYMYRVKTDPTVNVIWNEMTELLCLTLHCVISSSVTASTLVVTGKPYVVLCFNISCKRTSLNKWMASLCIKITGVILARFVGVILKCHSGLGFEPQCRHTASHRL